MVDQYGKCPVCGFDFKGESIVEAFKKQRDEGSKWLAGKTDEEIEKYVHERYSPPYCFSKIMGIEIQGKYDGVSYWQCTNCNTYWDRWTGEQFTETEFKLRV